jgi:hypothetical protein
VTIVLLHILSMVIASVYGNEAQINVQIAGCDPDRRPLGDMGALRTKKNFCGEPEEPMSSESPIVASPVR